MSPIARRAVLKRWQETLITLVVCLGYCGSVRSAEQNDLVIRTTIDPENSALVGQRVVFLVDVLARESWASLPKLPKIDLSGAFVYTPPAQSVRLNETIDGESFSGQRYEWWAFPQREGKLIVPSIKLDVQIKTFGANQAEKSQAKSTEAITLAIQTPSGAANVRDLLCATDFSATQKWSLDADSCNVGDGVTRTITRTVADFPALALTPLTFEHVAGVRAYRKQPEVNDQFNRGTLTGKRVESVTYTFESPGQVELPTMNVSWWDLESNQLKTEVLEGRQLVISPALGIGSTESAAESFVATQPRHWWTAGVLVVLAGVLYWTWRPAMQRLSSMFARWRSSEAAYFRRFLAEAESGHAEQTLRAITAWLDRISPTETLLSAEAFLTQFSDDEGAASLQQLYRALDSSKETFDAKRLCLTFLAARNDWNRQASRNQSRLAVQLPPLNPTTIIAR